MDYVICSRPKARESARASAAVPACALFPLPVCLLLTTASPPSCPVSRRSRYGGVQGGRLLTYAEMEQINASNNQTLEFTTARMLYKEVWRALAQRLGSAKAEPPAYGAMLRSALTDSHDL